MNFTRSEESSARSPLSLAWDGNTATAALVLGALLFLFLVARGFRGVSFGLGD